MAQAQNGSGSAAGMVRGCVVHCPFNIRLVAARAHFGIWKLIPNVDSAQNGTVLNETWAKTAPVVGGWFADGTVSAGELLLDCAADIRFITCQVRVESISRISYKPFSMRWPCCAVNARVRTLSQFPFPPRAPALHFMSFQLCNGIETLCATWSSSRAQHSMHSRPSVLVLTGACLRL